MHGLAQCFCAEDRSLIHAKISGKGYQYVSETPRLKNPIDWAKISTIAAILAVVLSVAAMFVSCLRTYH